MAAMTISMTGQEMERRHSAWRGIDVPQRNREMFERQRGRRRGPTPEMFFAKHLDNSRLVKHEDMERRREMVSFTLAMALLFALTMVYVWQHFSAIEVGYAVEAQKQTVEQLREENRQMRLQEAELSDPGRIAPLARRLGLVAPDPGQVVRPDGGDAPVLAQAKAPPLGNRPQTR